MVGNSWSVLGSKQTSDRSLSPRNTGAIEVLSKAPLARRFEEPFQQLLCLFHSSSIVNLWHAVAQWMRKNPRAASHPSGHRVGAFATKCFNFKTLIPRHDKTFTLLEESADALRAALRDVNLIEPEVMSAIEL